MTEISTRNPLSAGYAAMKANFLTPGTSGDVEIRTFEVSAADAAFTRIRASMEGRGYVREGTYTALYRRGGLWMSNTPDEIRDHHEPIRQAWCVERADGGRGAHRALVGGLGMGMVVAGLLAVGVQHIDVVEIDPDVIALAGPQIQALAAEHGATVVIHQADLYTIKWPAGTCWDVCWFDIWQDLTTDNLPEMSRLARSYGRRTGWQGSWGKDAIVAHKRRYGW